MALTKITTSVVAVNSLTAANIADNSIDATKIANNQILARHIAAGSLTDQLGTLPSATISGNLVVDTTTLVVDSSNNRVGIGTAGPAAPLDLAGNFIFKSPANTLYGNFDATTQAYAAFRLQAAGSNYGFIGQTSSLLASGGSNTALGLRSENEFVIATGGSTERMRIESSGQILITNETPSIKLVDSGDNSAQFIQAYGGFLRYYADDNNILSGSEHSWWIDGTRKMTLDSSGNLSVGNTDSTPYDRTSGNAIALGDGLVSSAQEGGNAAIFNRMTSDGSIVNFRKNGSSVGSIGTEGTDLTIGSGGAGFQFLESENKIRPFNMSTNSASNGVVDLGRANAKFKDLYLSGAIKMDSDLDDYEEGTFTPLFYGGTSGTAENSSSGYYTKIGRLVTLHVDVYNKTFGTYSGDLRMQLPFTNAGTSIPSSGGDVYFYPNSAWDGVSNFVGFSPSCYNTSYLNFTLITLDSDRQTQLSNSNTSTSGASGIFLRFSFTYVTTT